MTDIRRALEDAVAGFRPAPNALDRTLQKFRRRQGRQRLLAGGAALALSFATVAWLWVGFGGLAQPRVSTQERRQLEARLGALERGIREREALERQLRGQLRAAEAVTQELEGTLADLTEQLGETPLAAERREILERIKQVRAALEARLGEVAALKARLDEVAGQLARAVGQGEVLRQWLASLEDSP